MKHPFLQTLQVSSHTRNEDEQLYKDKNSKLNDQDSIGGFEEWVL